jgi:hypothetical protein
MSDKELPYIAYELSSEVVEDSVICFHVYQYHRAVYFFMIVYLQRFDVIKYALMRKKRHEREATPDRITR